MKNIIALLLSIFLISGSVVIVSASLPQYGEEWENAQINSSIVSFTDLPSTHWAYNYIAEMVNRKVINGYPDNKFRPNNTITRAEFAKIMVVASGIQPKKVNYNSFSDVPTTNWASPFVEAVKDYMTGYRTANGEYIFNPSSPATREDITVALVKLKGYDNNRLPDHSTIEAMFKDYAGISQSARDYVAIAVENGLVSGFQDETFRPQATITRAEATVMLWRAYQYGSDNKDVGGGQVTTPTPDPTPSTTNPSTPPSDSTREEHTNEPGIPNKFTVETLAGGTGKGDIDGPVRLAKLNYIDSMVVDNDNNIYFLNRNTKKIRKFNNSNGTIETFLTVDSKFNWDYTTEDKTLLQYSHEDFDPTFLGYSSSDNKLYLLGKSSKRYSYDNDFVFDITSGVTMATYALRDDEDGKVGYSSTDRTQTFLSISNDNMIYYGFDGTWRYGPTIMEGKQGNVAEIVGDYSNKTSIDFFGKSEAIITDNDMFIFDTGNGGILSKIQIYPRKVETVVKVGDYRSVTNYNGNFYLASGTSIYELTTDGKLSVFVDGKDLVYTDSNAVEAFDHISFDNNGNIIFYSAQSNSIRRINL